MRIMLINTNTSPAVTEKITAEARLHLAAENEIVGVNADFGAEIISTRSEMAISTHALIDACAKHAGEVGAVIVGMSLDAGVWAAREILEIPVIGMSEAALHMASLHGNRLGLFVFGGITQPYLEMAHAYGFGDRIGAVQALGVTPKEHLEDPKRVENIIVSSVNRLAKDNKIDTAILVGAVAAGLPTKLQNQLEIPTFEGISCAVLMVEAMARLNVASPKHGSFVAPKARTSSGLSPQLSKLLQRARD